MVTYKIENTTLHLNVEGMDKFWAFKSELTIPLEHITAVRTDTEIVKKWWHGLKLPGSNLPGVITAGTFYQDGRRVFWDIHHPEAAVVISLTHEKYSELVVEVKDPAAFVSEIQNAKR